MTDADRADTLTKMRTLAEVAQQQAEEFNGLLSELNELIEEEAEEGGSNASG